jgi:hypothetical protein
VSCPRRAVALLALGLTAAAAAPAVAGDEAAKAPDQILADAMAAVSQAPGITMAGTQTDADGDARVSFTVGAAGRATGTLIHGAERLRFVYTHKTSYFRANSAFWRGILSKRAARLAAAHWVDTGAALSGLTPKDVAACLLGTHGTLSTVGTSTLPDGTPAVTIADAGDVPGSAPHQLTVSDATPALPLRVTQTGRRRAGGPKDAACVDEREQDTTSASDLRITVLTAAPHVAVPKHALKLKILLQS